MIFFSRLRLFFDKKPLILNCINYGSMAALAEFTQQTIERRLGKKDPEFESIKVIVFTARRF
jgi:hypothetical protein